MIYFDLSNKICFSINYQIKQSVSLGLYEVAEQVMNSLCPVMHTHNTVYVVNEHNCLLNLSFETYNVQETKM